MRKYRVFSEQTYLVEYSVYAESETAAIEEVRQGEGFVIHSDQVDVRYLDACDEECPEHGA